MKESEQVKLYIKTKRINCCMECPNLWHPLQNSPYTISFFYCKKDPTIRKIPIDVVRQGVPDNCPLEDYKESD